MTDESEIIKSADLGMGWTATLYADGTLKLEDAFTDEVFELEKEQACKLRAMFYEYDKLRASRPLKPGENIGS